MPTDKETGKYRGFGFITFVNARDAEEASQSMHGTHLAISPWHTFGS